MNKIICPSPCFFTLQKSRFHVLPPTAPSNLHNRGTCWWRMTREMKDSEQEHFRSLKTERIQLSLPSYPLRLHSFLVPSRVTASPWTDGWTGWRTHRREWRNDKQTGSRASCAETADQPETGSGSSLEVATASLPEPEREDGEEGRERDITTLLYWSNWPLHGNDFSKRGQAGFSCDAQIKHKNIHFNSDKLKGIKANMIGILCWKSLHVIFKSASIDCLLLT